MAWLALEHWAGDPRASALLGSIVRTFRLDLSTWLGSVGAPGALASTLLRSWGADLRRVANDQDLRNTASYTPNRLTPPPHFYAVNAAEFLRDWWQAFEPTGNTPFQNVDAFLVRLALETATSSRPLTVSTAGAILNTVGLATSSGAILPFLTRQSPGSDPAVIVEASQVPNAGSPSPHHQVIARASLLLRVATGSVAKLMFDAGRTQADVQFWWEDLLRQRGIVSNTSPVTTTAGLWQSVSDALDNLDVWIAAASGTDEIRSLTIDGPSALAELGGSERVATWGLVA
jgi:hypothetical protein